MIWKKKKPRKTKVSGRKPPCSTDLLIRASTPEIKDVPSSFTFFLI